MQIKHKITPFSAQDNVCQDKRVANERDTRILKLY